MAKQSKARVAELRYIKRVRELRSKRKKRTPGKERTPWKRFFEQGVGAEMQTEIPRSSIHSIVYTYGKKMGKRFECSYSAGRDGQTSIKIEAVHTRDD